MLEREDRKLVVNPVAQGSEQIAVPAVADRLYLNHMLEKPAQLAIDAGAGYLSLTPKAVGRKARHPVAIAEDDRQVF